MSSLVSLYPIYKNGSLVAPLWKESLGNQLAIRNGVGFVTSKMSNVSVKQLEGVCRQFDFGTDFGSGSFLEWTLNGISGTTNWDTDYNTTVINLKADILAALIDNNGLDPATNRNNPTLGYPYMRLNDDNPQLLFEMVGAIGGFNFNIVDTGNGSIIGYTDVKGATSVLTYTSFNYSPMSGMIDSWVVYGEVNYGATSQVNSSSLSQVLTDPLGNGSQVSISVDEICYIQTAYDVSKGYGVCTISYVPKSTMEQKVIQIDDTIVIEVVTRVNNGGYAKVDVAIDDNNTIDVSNYDWVDGFVLQGGTLTTINNLQPLKTYRLTGLATVQAGGNINFPDNISSPFYLVGSASGDYLDIQLINGEVKIMAGQTRD